MKDNIKEKEKITKQRDSRTKIDAYKEAVGRRKTSSARVRIYESRKKEFRINNKTLDEYFATDYLRNIVETPIKKSKSENFKVSVLVSGGGAHSQADAIRLGIARALVAHSPEKRVLLKKEGLLKRDSRVIERKKFGLKKARRAPQWTKR